MTVKLDERDFIAYFWVADVLDGDNFLMMLRKREGQWLIDYRFRLKEDEKVFDSVDKKVAYQAECKPGMTESEAFKTCQELFQLTSEEFCMNRVYQRVNGDVEKFIKAVGKYECFHSKVIPRTGGEQNEGSR